MANHGVVIGGANVDDVATTLHTLICKLKSKTSTSKPESGPARRQPDFLTRGYIPCDDREVNLLAIKDELISRLRHEWALYPDHVVFLGVEANILERNFSMLELDERARCKPPFIIAVGDGVYESSAATPVQKSQLRCYFDVVARRDGKEELSTLNALQVSELLDWDAEKYRQSSTSKKQAVT
jgi:rhamnose utilization protein RhaD (predicted bifunctional aldolase and dehydrogenase)